MSPHERLTEILQNHPSSPFLFIGSGFSQRYLGTPTWSALLKEFCPPDIPYEYYLSNSDSKLSRCASLLSKDYSAYWWKSPDLALIREKYKKHITSSSSPIKAAISESLQTKYKIAKDPNLVEELAALRAFNAEGIITTNWDCLIESLFPGYKVYIGQQSVVRQTPQNVAEIYKIHGCCTEPNSLVLTEDDYQTFKEKQAYLAAKLITIFVEHPVVFIGYSISDTNITDLLKSIIKGLGSEEIAKLQRNLIFLQRATEKRPEGVNQTILVVDDTNLPITNIVSNDFTKIYEALSQTKLKLPARILRFCKEQLYELISSKEPSQKLCLVDIDNIEDKNNIEFVVGLGVINNQLSDRGYAGVTTTDLFKYSILGTPALDPKKVLEQTFPDLDNGNNFLPVFKALSESNITALSAAPNETVRRCASLNRNSFKTASYERAALRAFKNQDFASLIKDNPPEKAAVFIPHLPDEKIDMDAFKAFATEHLDKLTEHKYSTFFRKAFCFYDFLKHNGKSVK